MITKLNLSTASFIDRLNKPIDENTEFEVTLTDCDDASFREILELLHRKNASHTIRSLTIDNQNLTTIPNEIRQLSNLVELDLNHNKITKLPEALTQCKNLEVILLYDNSIAALPENMGHLTKLEVLDVQKNRLLRLPDSLGECRNLVELNIEWNKVPVVRGGFFYDVFTMNYFRKDQYLKVQEGLLANFTNLQHLYLRDLNLECLPPDVFKLKRLRTLAISKNKITKLPPEIVKLKNLEELYVASNRISIIPKSIGKLGNLCILDLDENSIRKLPDSLTRCIKLEKLYLRKCELTCLPDDIGKLKNLKCLSAGGNQLEYLPNSLTACKSLEGLYIWNNRLTHLPEDIGDLDKLEILQMAQNRFTTLPASFRSLNLNEEKLNMDDVLYKHMIYRLFVETRDYEENEEREEDESDDVEEISTLGWPSFTRDMTSLYDALVTDTLTPYSKTTAQGHLTRTYGFTPALNGSQQLLQQVRSGGANIVKGLDKAGVGALKTTVLTLAATGLSARRLGTATIDMGLSFLSMQCVVLSYCIAAAARGIFIDPLVGVYNLVQYARDKEQFDFDHVLPSNLRNWYQQQMASVLQENELGYSSHQFAHQSAARHISLIAAMVDLIVYQSHLFVKTSAKGARAVTQASSTVATLTGAGLSETAIGLWQTTQGAAELAAILLTIAKIPVKLAVTEANMFYSERYRAETFEDSELKQTQALENRLLHGLSLGASPAA